MHSHGHVSDSVNSCVASLPLPTPTALGGTALCLLHCKNPGEALFALDGSETLTDPQMSSYCATLTLVLQIPSCNLSGYTKRVTGSAFVFLGYCVGNIIGPQAFIASEAPSYPSGCKTLISCNCIQVGLVGALWLLLRRRNATRDKARAGSDEAGSADRQPLMDITDFEVLYTYYMHPLPQWLIITTGPKLQISVLKPHCDGF